MEPLTEAQLAVLRRRVGNGLTVEELQAVYDRTENLTETAREILEIRLATMLADPASFNVAGEYSQDTSTNIKEIRSSLAWLGDLDSPETTDDEDTLGTVEIFDPCTPHYLR